MKKFKVVIDSGHGGKDSGAVGNGLEEKYVTLDLANRIQNLLEENPDIECELTRAGDDDLTLLSRTKFANSIKPDCLVSVHINAASATDANGFESFVFTTDDEQTKSFALQSAIHTAVAPLWTSKNRMDRGKKKANFHMVREFKGAATLLEFGFVSNKVDAELLKNKSFLQANAEAVASGILRFLGVTKSVTPKAIKNVYRVLVDDKQIGAYSEKENILEQVELAIEAGKTNISLQLAK